MNFSSLLLCLLTFCFPIAQPLHGAIQSPKKDLKSFSTLEPIKSGDSLYSILQNEGFSQQQTGRMIAATPGVKNFILVPKNNYRVTTKAGLKRLRFYNADSDLTYNFERTAEGFRAYSEMEEFRTEVAEFSGEVHGSLIASIKKVVPSSKVAYRFMDAYLLEYDLAKDLVPGAQFKIGVEKKFDGDHFVRYGEIVKTTLQIKGKKVSKRFVAYDKGGAFVNANGIASDRPLYAPVEYVSVSSQYHPSRRHPITKRLQPHYGIDFVLPSGAPILAAASGKVLRYGYGRAPGHYVVIAHANGKETYYNHMKEIASHIKRGTQVRAGERIGANGCTGYCTKPHLHFAVKVRGQWKNPAGYLRYYPRTAAEHINRKIASLNNSSKAL